MVLQKKRAGSEDRTTPVITTVIEVSMELTFEEFPKIPRLKRECIITEKIDGTNAQVAFNEAGDILCGSRRRVITPDNDNFGFARWAYEHQRELYDVLGPGRHFGEWWGAGIQRRYSLDHKRFSLFNTARWMNDDIEKLKAIDGLDVVPVLYAGRFDSGSIEHVMDDLRGRSVAAANLGVDFDNPEGIIVYQSAARQLYKYTYEHDERGKPE